MKKLTNKLIVLLVTFMMVASLTACGSANDNSSTATNTPEATTSSEVSYPLTVTGTDGTEVTLDEEPEKIVSCAPNITEMVYKLGVSDKLVGRTDYCDYPEEVSEVESIGTLTEPDLEKIISLQPDLVIASTHFDEENAKKLEEANIPVLVLYEEHDVTGVYTMIETLGNALNCSEAATTTVEEMKTEISDVEEAVKDADPVSVYYVVGYGEYGDYTAGGDTFIHGMITAAGGENIASDVSGWSYSLETLLEKDPEVIIVGIGEKEAFMASENYSSLTAVKEDKVYELDTNLFNRQGYRNAEGIKELAEILHPDLVK